MHNNTFNNHQLEYNNVVLFCIGGDSMPSGALHRRTLVC